MAGQAYVALSRVTSLNGLFLTGTFKESAFVVDERVVNEYERLRNHCLFKVHDTIFEQEFSMALCNVRSLKKHVVDLKADKRFLKSNLILCTETQIGLNETPDIAIDGFDSIMNNAEHKFSSLCVYAKEGIVLNELYRNEGVLLVSIQNNQCNFKVLILNTKKRLGS